MVDMNPKHIAFSHSHGLLQRTFAEWYLLGLGQHMVANRISTRSSSGDYYTGRVSSFWKTTWTFQLNDLFYDADHCRLRTLPMDGTWHNAMVRFFCYYYICIALTGARTDRNANRAQRCTSICRSRTCNTKRS